MIMMKSKMKIESVEVLEGFDELFSENGCELAGYEHIRLRAGLMMFTGELCYQIIYWPDPLKEPINAVVEAKGLTSDYTAVVVEYLQEKYKNSIGEEKNDKIDD